MLFKKHQSGIESNNAFLVKFEDLVREIVTQNDIPYYRIESALKNQAHDGGDYAVMPVIRIVTYFEDSVNQIADILKTEFEITVVESTDKNKSWVDSFSSKNLDYLVGLKPNRLHLTEYKKLGSGKFEIQVCSMLQDAWTGMEKELSYDGEHIPDEVKRDFYRIGAFLEMSDLELSKIKKTLNAKSADKTDNVAAPVVPPVPAIKEAVVPVVPQPEVVAVVPERVVAVPEHVAVIPEPVVAVPEHVAVTPEPFVVTPSHNDVDMMESIDMNVDSFGSLAMNVDKVENKNGISDETIDHIMSGSKDITTPVAHEDPAAKEEINTPTADAQAGGVALNIDTVQNFNMNVNGMIEREIIREVGSGAAAGVGAAAGIGAGQSIEDKINASQKENKPAGPIDENAQMTDASLKEYVMNSKLLKEVDSHIAERAGARLNEDIDIEGDVERLRFLKVFTLKQLHERIADNKNDIVAFAEKWIGKDNGGTFDSGICLFYLEYLLVGKKNDPAFAVEYVLKFISDNDYSARYIIPTYNSIRNTVEPSSFSHLTLK